MAGHHVVGPLADGSHSITASEVDPATGLATMSAGAQLGILRFTIDTVAPSVPTGLTATAAGVSAINLSWTAATDTVGVAGYKVFRDGGTTPLGIVTSGTTFADTGLAPSLTHS